MSAYEVEKKNNIARNHESLKQLSLVSAASTLMQAISSSATTPKQISTPGSPMSSTPQDPAWPGAAGDGGSVRTDSMPASPEGAAGMDLNIQPILAPSSKSNPLTDFQAQESWPDWMKSGWGLLMVRDRGKAWDQVVANWAELECGYLIHIAGNSGSAAGHASGLPTAGRPDAVAWWLGRSQKHLEDEVPIGNINAYIALWWAWWKNVNPGWCTTAEGGRLQAGGQGDWNCLRIPRPNGLLMVLLALGWWFSKINKSAHATWEEAVRDVAWVVNELQAIHDPLPTRVAAITTYV
jgi:hypothetical protein